ncbi:hypothetical protein BU23DRAFT_564523 [Bimuria novae-zelandiae CBS 107.79]|uniref:Uncharacterized protein n=1 Tax=Bimuria novae-zelandiae CBS 107.79 TaxID=1447943 RepID=A0A6A5VNX6_9PLEO|nr:hypothetical protein BU23DRAFT_564523 [Bimuria novae-zelandiae CBS 107.79]
MHHLYDTFAHAASALEALDPEHLARAFNRETTDEDLQQINAAVDRVKKRNTANASILKKTEKRRRVLPLLDTQLHAPEEVCPKELVASSGEEAIIVAEFGEDAAPPCYLASCPSLLVDTLLSYAYLIDQERFYEGEASQNVRLRDGVATTFWNFDQMAFYKFFDLSIREFEWITKTKARAGMDDHAIRREGNIVTYRWQSSGVFVHLWNDIFGHSIAYPSGKLRNFDGTPRWNSYEMDPLLAFSKQIQCNPVTARKCGKDVAESLIG